MKDDDDALAPSSPYLRPPRLEYFDRRLCFPLRPKLLIIAISSPSFHFFRYFSESRIVNLSWPFPNGWDISTIGYIHHDDGTLCFADMSRYSNSAENCHAAVKLLVDGDQIIPDRVVIFSSNFSPKLLREKVDETFVLKSHTSSWDGSMIEDLEYLPPDSVIHPLADALFDRYKNKGSRAMLLVSWPHTGDLVISFVRSIIVQNFLYEILGFEVLKNALCARDLTIQEQMFMDRVIRENGKDDLEYEEILFEDGPGKICRYYSLEDKIYTYYVGADPVKICSYYSDYLLETKKLCLLIRWGALVDSVGDCQNIPYTKYSPSSFEIDVVQTSWHTTIKCRPFARNFLKEARKWFDIYLQTPCVAAAATEDGADFIAKLLRLLDPFKELFDFEPGSLHVISNYRGRSDLHKMFVAEQGGGLGVEFMTGNTLAIDTQKRGSMNHVVIDKYHYFGPTGLFERKLDECERSGTLASLLKFLREVHKSVYPEDKEGTAAFRDLGEVVKMVRKSILKGCNLIFSAVWRRGTQAHDQTLWLWAEELGATCVERIDHLITHVVSTNAGTEKSLWAKNHGKFLVTPQWIEAAYFIWRRLPERNFKVDT